jgi:hypothetical protein
MLTRLCFILFSIFLTSYIYAAELSGDLTKKDIKQAAKVVSWSSVHRAWTAPGSHEELGLGLNLGVESTFIPRKNLNELGNKNGIAPSIIPVPKLWTAWELPADFYISGSYSPGMLYDGITTAGGAIQWSFFKDDRVTLSTLLHYTYAKAFQDLKSHTTGLNLQVAKDLGLWFPYFGVGFLSANATASKERTHLYTNTGPYTIPALHGFIGARIDLGAELSFQIDLTGAKVSFALMMSQGF